jgi:hypothetical protein
VALVRTDISEELRAFIIWVTRITLKKEALSPTETSLLTRNTWRNIPEDAILHDRKMFIGHCRVVSAITRIKHFRT